MTTEAITMSNELSCAGCARALKRSKSFDGSTEICRDCGTTWRAPERATMPASMPPPRYAPDPPRVALVDCALCATSQRDASRAGMPRRCVACGKLWLRYRDGAQRPWRPRDPKAQCAQLAEWLPTICGSAAPPEPTIGSGAGRTNGRRDSVDEHHADLRDACATISHMDAMARAGFESHAEILWVAYVCVGDTLHMTHKPGGRDDIVGMRFSTAEQRTRWNNHKSPIIRRTEPSRLGERLIVEATARYLNLAMITQAEPEPAHAVTARMLDEAVGGA